MVDISARAPTRSIEEDREVLLTNGVTIDLSTINLRLGDQPNRQQLQSVIDRVQTGIDHIESLTDLPDDEARKTMTAAELKAKYGDVVFLDGSGNLVTRHTKFSLRWSKGALATVFTVVPLP